MKSSQVEVSVLSLYVPNVESVFGLCSSLTHLVMCRHNCNFRNECYFLQSLESILYLTTKTTYLGGDHGEIVPHNLNCLWRIDLSGVYR